jgi:hypothetical protein
LLLNFGSSIFELSYITFIILRLFTSFLTIDWMSINRRIYGMVFLLFGFLNAFVLYWSLVVLIIDINWAWKKINLLSLLILFYLNYLFRGVMCTHNFLNNFLCSLLFFVIYSLLTKKIITMRCKIIWNNWRLAINQSWLVDKDQKFLFISLSFGTRIDLFINNFAVCIFTIIFNLLFMISLNWQ